MVVHVFFFPFQGPVFHMPCVLLNEEHVLWEWPLTVDFALTVFGIIFDVRA